MGARGRGNTLPVSCQIKKIIVVHSVLLVRKGSSAGESGGTKRGNEGGSSRKRRHRTDAVDERPSAFATPPPSCPSRSDPVSGVGVGLLSLSSKDSSTSIPAVDRSSWLCVSCQYYSHPFSKSCTARGMSTSARRRCRNSIMEASPLYRHYQWRFATRKGEIQYLSDCFKSSTRKYSTKSSSLNQKQSK